MTGAAVWVLAAVTVCMHDRLEGSSDGWDDASDRVDLGTDVPGSESDSDEEVEESELDSVEESELDSGEESELDSSS